MPVRLTMRYTKLPPPLLRDHLCCHMYSPLRPNGTSDDVASRCTSLISTYTAFLSPPASAPPDPHPDLCKYLICAAQPVGHPTLVECFRNGLKRHIDIERCTNEVALSGLERRSFGNTGEVSGVRAGEVATTGRRWGGGEDQWGRFVPPYLRIKLRAFCETV